MAEKQLVLRDDSLSSDDSELSDEHCDVKYARELQLQEARMASSFISSNPGFAASSMAEDNPLNQQQHVMKEVGESSLKFCEICKVKKDHDQSFTVKGCKHSFCIDCINKHIQKVVARGVHIVKCPVLVCKSVLEFDSCTSFMPKNTLDKWNEILCRSLVLDSQKFYCPYEYCSAMLLRDTDEMITESMCPECKRKFCAQCCVPWHSGIGCEEFQKLNEEERVREDNVPVPQRLAKWKRCPQCTFL